MDSDLLHAFEVLRAGRLAVVPTDTVYGLTARALDPRAVERVLTVKGRATVRGLPLLIDSPSAVLPWIGDLPGWALRCMHAFWPGGLTLVLSASELARRVLPGCLAAEESIAFRMPDAPWLSALLRLEREGTKLGPLIGTSANPSGRPTGATLAEVRAALGSANGIDHWQDGGRLEGRPSTLIDARGPHPRLLREGPIGLDLILRGGDAAPARGA